MSRATHNTLELELCGKTYIAKPTLEMYEKIERFKHQDSDGAQYVGLNAILVKIQPLILSDIADIVCFLCDIKKSQHKEIKRGIFEAGITSTTIKISSFLTGLLNPSGKDEEDKEESEPGE